MRLNIGISAILVAVAVSLAACGGGKVVVVPPSAPAAATALVTPASPVVVTVPATPPPPTTETSVASVSPGPEYVWVQGYYNWDGSRYEWVLR
jgi:YXWGXW repeat-containing protein